MAAMSDAQQAPPRSSAPAVALACATLQDCRFQGGLDAQARRLAERDEADGGGDHVGAGGVQKGKRGVVLRHAMSGGEFSDRDGIGQGLVVASPRRARERRQARRPPLRAALQSPFRGGAKRHAQRRHILAPMRQAEQNRVGPERAEAQRVLHPGAQARLVTHIAGFHRPFQPVRIGEAAGGKGGREPGEQAQERKLSHDRRRVPGRTARFFGSAAPPRPRIMSAIT